MLINAMQIHKPVYILTQSFPLEMHNLKTDNKMPDARLMVPPYTHNLVHSSCVSPVPRMLPPPGPPIKTPKPSTANPMPKRVPTLLLSFVSRTKHTGGSA